MSREEYLSCLRNNIMSLTQDEQDAAIQYYSDYFEEANDDEKVIADLGTPEELAKSIIEKFANALVTKEQINENENKEEVFEKNSNALFFSFSQADVKNIYFKFGAANVFLTSTDAENITIETRGLIESDFKCTIKDKDCLYVENTNRLGFLNFFNHERTSRMVPKILIFLPKKINLKHLDISVGAGLIRSENLDVLFESSKIDIGAGNAILNGFNGGKIKANCAMGNLEYTGTLSKESLFDCGMGNMVFKLTGDISEYSYDCKVGLGKIKINDNIQSGITKNFSSSKKENHLSINCGMGNVEIKINK